MQIIKLFWSYLKIGAANELQYRANFFVQILQSFIALAVGLIGLNLVFNQTSSLAGWTQPELLAVMGVYILMGGVIQATIQPNMQRLLEEIQEGTLDYTLVKPIDAQAIVSVREFRMWKLVDVLVGIVVLVTAMLQLQASIGALQALVFSVALCLGGIMIYCFWLILTTSAFWFIRIGELANLFEGVFAAGRWPVGIYPDWLRVMLTFLVPVAFAVTIPAEALTGRLTPTSLLAAAGLALGLSILARLIWKIGLRNYSGASA